MNFNSADNSTLALDSFIDRLQYLQSLSLFKNELTALPKSIGRLTNLTFLEASCNRIDSIPYDLGSCLSLRFIDLSSNNLRGTVQGLVSLGMQYHMKRIKCSITIF